MSIGGGDAPKVEETPEERELAAIASEKFEHYGTHYAPLEQKAIDLTYQLAGKPVQRRVEGVVSTAVEKVQGRAADEVADSMLSRGVDPTSGTFKGASGVMALNKGGSKGRARTKGALDLHSNYLQSLEGVVGIGQGKSVGAQRGITDLATDASREAVDEAATQFNDNSAGARSAGMLAGLGTSWWMNRKPAEG